MKQKANQKIQPRLGGTRNAIAEYLAALEEAYPAARGKARVVTRADKMVIVKIPLPARETERMRLFDRMAEVGTKLLIETDEYIILSGC